MLIAMSPALAGPVPPLPTGPLTTPRAERPGRVVPPPEARRWQVHGPQDPERSEVEAFIRGVFARRHGARLRHFAPQLVSLRIDGELVAAAGYRCAADGPLFLERYLDLPVEQGLCLADGAVPPRQQIVEVGHLAAGRAGEGRRLILQLGPHLAALGHRWVVGTLTDELRSLFTRLGIEAKALGIADPARLGDAQAVADWGRYYEHRPMVLAGHLPLALLRLAARGTHP